MKKFFLVLLMCVALSKGVFAYLDPGTGGIIAGSLWPLIVVFFSAIGAFLVKRFWNPIKRVFSGLFGKDKSNKKE